MAGSLIGMAAVVAGLTMAPHPPVAGAARVIRAVGAENFYANVIRQVGGSHVAVLAIISNPATDPHTYESSTTDASAAAIETGCRLSREM